MREKCLVFVTIKLHDKVIMVKSIIFIVITNVSNNNYINNSLKKYI